MNTIVVTGASSGIGRTVTERFLGDGWRVGMIARQKDRLDSIAETPEFAIPLACDVTTGRVLHRCGRPKRRRFVAYFFTALHRHTCRKMSWRLAGGRATCRP